jgi:integrase
VAEYLTSGRAPSRDDDEPITVSEAMVPYIAHVHRFYIGQDGKPTNQTLMIRLSLKVLRRLYGDTPARDFGPLALKACRAEFIRQGLSRTEVNRRTALIRQFFVWCAGEELIPAVNIEALRCVRGLEKGRTEARETEPVLPVDDAVVDATLPHLPAVVRAMVEVQRLTGARPAEVCRVTTGAIDQTDDVWVYRPARHKTAHRGHDRIILVGPRAQDIIRPLLRPDAPDAPLFSPAARMADLSAQRREARQTPLYEAHKRAQEAKRARHRKRAPRDSYDAGSYRRAIHRACDRAGIARWCPNQLRHSAATRIRAEAGIDVASTVLGHSVPNTILIYAERDLEAAKAVISKLG